MKRPQLQLAVDVLSEAEALQVVERIYPYFDIIEVGTPLIIEDGLSPVERLKAKYPDKQVLADLKVMDAGKIEAGSGFRRGADIVTVLGVADDATIRGAVEMMRQHGRLLMADLINTAHPAARAAELEKLGVPIVCVHTAYDVQGAGGDPLAELHAVRQAVKCRVAIAGGLKLANIPGSIAGGADIVIVGGGILNAPDPRAAAKAIMEGLGA